MMKFVPIAAVQVKRFVRLALVQVQEQQVFAKPVMVTEKFNANIVIDL